MGGVLGVQACHERSHPRLLDDLARLRSRPHPLAPAATIRESACPFGSPPGPRLTALLAEAHTGLPRPDFRERNSRDNLAQASWCCRCRQWLPLEDFRPRLELGGPESWCRRCHADANRLWRAKNPAAVAAYNARRRQEYREKHAPPTRPCVVCGKPFAKRPNALVAARSAGASASSSSDEC
jgi:hypothetical protein